MVNGTRLLSSKLPEQCKVSLDDSVDKNAF